jgi:hypothetical protein
MMRTKNESVEIRVVAGPLSAVFGGFVSLKIPSMVQFGIAPADKIVNRKSQIKN